MLSAALWVLNLGREQTSCWGISRQRPLAPPSPVGPLRQKDYINLTKECGSGRGRESSLCHLGARSGVTLEISIVLVQTIFIFSQLRGSF